jgi:peptidoglycan-associated lipoprotein
MAACSATPEASQENLPPTLVTRTSDATVWTTAEAEAAAKAAAAQRQASSRNPPSTPPARPAAVAPSAAAAQATAAPATVAPPAPADAGPPARLIYFDFDSYELKPDFSAAIEAHARALAAAPGRSMVIEGHADERGGAEYNLALGQKRAQAVVKALRLLGVADAQIEAVSFGDTRPVARGASEEAWAQNRRAELKDR